MAHVEVTYEIDRHPDRGFCVTIYLECLFKADERPDVWVIWSSYQELDKQTRLDVRWADCRAVLPLFDIKSRDKLRVDASAGVSMSSRMRAQAGADRVACSSPWVEFRGRELREASR